jgi:ATP-dependent DNA helicase RecQ
LDLHKQILIKYWGYPDFRPKQEEIILSILSAKDTLAILPTGGGKSITYQLPGLILDGISLVISPLISLMNDQVDDLKERNINAIALNSSLNFQKYEWSINQLHSGQTKFLFISPERLQSAEFLTVITNLKISQIVVDEAHCISQWGYDFRPPYLKIADIRTYFPSAPVLALTASATPEVAKDIQNKLLFKRSHLIQKSFNRKNLIYYVSKSENKLGLLLRLINKQKGSGIVYVRSRKKTQEIAEFLNSRQISSASYHAGLDSRLRDSRQKKWKDGSIHIIVATNAFGMGIDKGDVRFVAHLDIPDNPEAYYQEAGRAGRDGKKAFAIVFWEDSDIDKLKTFFSNSFPPIKTIKQVYAALGNYLQLAIGSGISQTFKFDISDFSKQYVMSPVTVFNCLNILEKQGLIKMNDSIHKPSQIKMKLQGNELYKYQVEHSKYDNIIKYLLRNYSGIFQDYTSINEIQIQKVFNLDKGQLNELLKRLEKNDVIYYIPESNHPEIVFLQERLDTKNLYISPENYKNRKEAAHTRMLAMIRYISSNNKCRNQLILAYFGEEESKRCGLCDVCLERNKTDLNKLEFDQVIDIIKPILKANPMILEDLVLEAKDIDQEKLLRVIVWLKENDKIVESSDFKLHWPA